MSIFTNAIYVLRFKKIGRDGISVETMSQSGVKRGMWSEGFLGKPERFSSTRGRLFQNQYD